MSSPNHSTFDIEDAFSSMNILNYTSVSLDYFSASSENSSFNSLENSNIIPSVIPPFYDNLKITQEVLNAAAGGIFLYKTPNQAYQLLEDKVLLKLDWAKNQKTKSSLKKTVAFADEGSSNSDTDKIMARMDAMTLKMDAQYKELQSNAKKTKPDLDEDDIPMSREEEAKFMQTFRKTRFYNDYRDRDSNRDNWHLSGRNDYNRDNYRSNTDDKPYDLQKQFNDFMKSQQSTNAFVKETFMDLKTQLETVAKNHQASIQNLETKFDRLADKQSGRPSGSLPSNTQPNPKGHNSKAYQPPQACNERVNEVFTRSGKSYNPPVNPNDQQNDSETPINFDSNDEGKEPTPQPKTQNPKPVKETPLPKPYKPKIPYPQLLRKEKMEAQYGKFLNMIRVVRINVPLIDILAGMPNYGKFLKELISNKHKIEQISAAFLSDESSAMIQNKVPPKLGDPESFLIPCNFNKTFSCNALADLGASINLMPYSLYAKLSLETLKPTKMSVRLADRSFQYPVRIAENMLVEVVIRVKQKQLNLGVGTERMIFNIDSAMKHSYSNDDTCFSIDVIDEILEEDFDALLDEGSKILHSIEGTLLEEEIFAEFDEFMAMTADENSDSEFDTEEPPFKKITINTDYKIKTSLEEPPTDLELKPLPDNLEYVFLEEPSFLPVIISSQLTKEKKNKLVYVLKKHKQAFAWKTTDIPGICPSFCKHKIQLLDDKKPVVQKQRRLNPNMQEVVKKEIVKLLDTGIIYPIADSPWVSPIHCVPKKGGITVVTNKNNELVLTRTFYGLANNPAIWSRKLDDALWAFRTAYITPTGTTPYKLIYGKNYHLPFEIKHRAYWALKNCNPDLITADEKRMFQLHELDELRHQAYENSHLYKERTKVWHDRKLRIRKEFKQGNKFLLFHSKYKFKQPKLKSRWLGPYVVKHQYLSGYVKLYGKGGKTFIVNGHRLKLYHEEDNDSREAVTPFFPKE
ncbi:reverse transcriptase domain-containing protein [Tanacetum coccineum]|uniref:Reverse transcriptase domain-containing protein n=1 Tax=Tanacetum coccineum TaxID=301880 RepID=A0ABQ5IKR4_9ASTR